MQSTMCDALNPCPYSAKDGALFPARHRLDIRTTLYKRSLIWTFVVDKNQSCKCCGATK
ncbi:hypothetical protein THICB1_80008 [Thiomonas arsenitoxydans]|uniref:Transposase n=1 Tax=Thiomonas arsenitoxydans (strain DSM 22701 / CIP 110005 / 3As) TaxID=426114 RepID=A0ABP1Z9E0_THIA3|nr:hypothetical protein THICB2_30049 [Thiomonas sp. CB2]CQR36746.1 hypothetical protein ACO7_490159 [Thiomonas arsenitoxydans]VDY10233.1 protein of unknown function [Thiomonas sp. Sup16B3]VDY14744.1 conserved protein of unknown function [Thiomonas sp. OC7]CQR36747.1 hypothetical protein ACO3_490159 [Thiomonas arsenitoxydans]